MTIQQTNKTSPLKTTKETLPGTREKLPRTIETNRSQRIGAVVSVVVAEEVAVATEEVAVSEAVEVVASEVSSEVADEAGQGDTTMTSMCSRASDPPEII